MNNKKFVIRSLSIAAGLLLIISSYTPGHNYEGLGGLRYSSQDVEPIMSRINE